MKNFTKIATLFVAMIAMGCNNEPRYSQTELAAIQPCMSMGFAPAQCYAAFQQAGRPQNNDHQWLGTVAAFAAGAAANHWWNKTPSYVYHPEYLSQPDYYDRNYKNQPNRQWITPNVAGIQQKTDSSIQYIQQPQITKVEPIKNTNQLIKNQQVQPIFKPNVLVENGTKSNTPPVASSPVLQLPSNQPMQNNVNSAPAFKPIQVVPATTTAKVPQMFKPNEVVKPIRVVPTYNAPAAKAFTPIRVSPPSKTVRK